MDTRESLTIPLVSLSKQEIDLRTEDFLNSALENHTPDELYVFSKQLETAADYIIGKLKVVAFEAIANRFVGAMTGSILGHGVRLSYPERWKFSGAVDDLVKQQKLELDALKAKEKADGLAHKEPGSGIITVTIRGV